MRSGGIRRIFDKPPPRQLRIASANFLSSGALTVFLLYLYRAKCSSLLGARLKTFEKWYFLSFIF